MVNSFYLVTTAVEMVDVGIQSETEELSDIETSVYGAADRKPSLQVVPEEEHEDGELVTCEVHCSISVILCPLASQSCT